MILSSLRTGLPLDPLMTVGHAGVVRPLRADEIRGNWATLLVSWKGDGSLDLPAVGRFLDRLAVFKVDGVYSGGTAGELHALEEAEHDAVSELLAERCEAHGLPFQVGVSHPFAPVMLSRLRRAVRLRPSAVQVILPDWFPLADSEALDFLRRMEDAAEGVGLVLYNPPHAKRRLTPAALRRLAESTPGLVGVKVPGGDEAWYAEMGDLMRGLSVFVPGHHLASGFARGAAGAYSNMACLHPGAAQAWWDLMGSDLRAALGLESRIRSLMDEHIAPFIVRDGYCNGACDRLLALVGGWGEISPRLRWPYRSIPLGEVERLRPIARRALPEFFP